MKKKGHNGLGTGQSIAGAAVLGGTGVVGQVFVSMLADHPWFKLELIAGSQSRDGKYYGEDVRWQLPFPMPENVRDKKLDALSITQPVNDPGIGDTRGHVDCDSDRAANIEKDVRKLKERGIQIVFSALPSEVARRVEPVLRENGFWVFSNASALRYETDVPILIPDANPGHLDWIERQGYPGRGFVITNANCSTTGLAAALAPLTTFPIKEIHVSTYQSISGAGYPGLSALDIMGNAVPHIPGEEEKMIVELEKILELDADLYPHCVRIPVPFGHLETVWLSFDRDVETDEIRDAWECFTAPTGHLPSIPGKPVVHSDAPDFPQPRLSFWGNPAGMQTFVGRLRKVNGRIGFSLLSNNLVKGAAGGSIANAEYFFDRYIRNKGGNR